MRTYELDSVGEFLCDGLKALEVAALSFECGVDICFIVVFLCLICAWRQTRV